MLQLNYAQHFNQLVNENEASHSWFSHSWDYGHLLQLSHQDVFDQKSNKWVQKVAKTISSIHHEVGYGKSYDEFVNLASENDSQCMSPIGFSSTRWLTYSERVFRSFITNYPALYDRLEGH